MGMGWGYASTKQFPLNENNDGANINTQYYVKGEVEGKVALTKNAKSKLGIFGGLGMNAVYPEKFTYNNGTSINNNGTMLDLFLGTRYYIPIAAGKENTYSDRDYQLYLQAKLAFPFTNGFTEENGNASSAYFGFGVGLTTLESTASLQGRNNLMDIESGAFMAVNSKVSYGQFVFPINIVGNLSIGINAHIGLGYGKSSNNDENPTHYYGFGGDLRFFAHDPTRISNPYFGAMRTFYGYNFDNKKYTGKLTYLRIGNQFRFANEPENPNDQIKNFFSNLYLDVNLAVPFNVEEEWINYTLTNLNYQSDAIDVKGGYIKHVDSLTLNIPANIDFSIGLVYKFNRPKAKMGGRYRAKYDVYNEKDLRRLEYALENIPNEFKESNNGPLPMETLGESLTERRIYIMRKECEAPGDTPQTPDVVIEQTDIIPYINASDIKMFSLNYQARTNIGEVSNNMFDTEPQPEDSVVLLVAAFDAERTKAKKLKNTNMCLVFTDLNTGQMYGFGYDSDRRLQPENPEKFMKELRWLDSDDIYLDNGHIISGPQVANDVFKELDTKANKERSYKVNQNNYRLAYAIYPKDIFDYMNGENFGVSINFRFAGDSEGSNENVVLGNFIKDGDSYRIDKNNASFFSNMIVGRNLILSQETKAPETNKLDNYHNCNQTINIGNFLLGSDKLTREQEREIFEAAKLSIHCNVSIILGYTDKVEFLRNAEFMNEFLNYENNLINNLSPEMETEWTEISQQWNDQLQSDPNALPSNKLCQRALAWERIRTVLEELNKYDLIDMKNIQVKAEGILSDENNSSIYNNPEDRKVVIMFSGK